MLSVFNFSCFPHEAVEVVEIFLHRDVSKDGFHRLLPTIAPKEQYPETITEPLTWLPHPVNPSGVTQTWLVGAKMGPVNDELIHIGYNRPELFRVLMGDNVEPRREFIQKHALDVRNLDV